MNTYNNSINLSNYTKKYFKDYTLLKIETTGLSKFSDSIFMISLLEINTQKLSIHYISNLKEEYELIKLIAPNKYITFNGNNFDISFIKEKSKFYQLNLDIQDYIDFHDYLKNYNFILNLPSLKQIEIEKHLGINREKYVSGFKVSKLIQEFLITKDENKLKSIINHSSDSVKYLEKILYLHKQIEDNINFSISNSSFRVVDFNFKNNFLYILGTTTIDKELELNDFTSSIKISNYKFQLTIEVKEGEYSDGEKVIYLIDKKSELKNISKLISPPNIYILFYKNPLWENIIEISKFYIAKILSI